MDLRVSPAARKYILERGDTVYVYRGRGWAYRHGFKGLNTGLKVTIEPPPPELSFDFHEVDDVRVALESGLPDRETLTVVLWRLPRTLAGFDRRKATESSPIGSA
jgi:hypothetical protein